jgi:protein-disulfide isomerase
MTTPSTPSPRKKPASPDRRSRRQARAEEEAKRKRQKRLMTLLAAVLVVAVAGVTVFAIINSRDESKNTPLASPMALDQIPRSGMTIGATDAPVTVIEYADFQCPYCANFALQLEPELIQNYVATGKVRFEFQPLPIISVDLKGKQITDPSAESVLASEAGFCAADQNTFWEFYSLLFSKQTGEEVGDFTLEKLIGYAKEGGLDVDAFTTCMTNRTHLQDVVDSYQRGKAAGVTGTPTFFVNGTKVLGYGQLEQTIQDKLNGG